MNQHVPAKNDDRSTKTVEAIALVDGTIPIDCEIGERRAIDFELVARAEINLMFARRIHARGRHREAFEWAVRASQELFDALGGDRSIQEPLKHLFFALNDLERGTQDRALVAEKVDNRRILATSEWNARACLAAALHARVMQGQTRDSAAEIICKRTPIVADGSSNNKTRLKKLLIDWRAQFKNGTPPAGMPTWEGGLEVISYLQNQVEEWRRPLCFAAFEDNCLQYATDYRDRGPARSAQSG